MSIRGDLVYNSRSGEIIGFVNPRTWNFEKVCTVVIWDFLYKGLNFFNRDGGASLPPRTKWIVPYID